VNVGQGQHVAHVQRLLAVWSGAVFAVSVPYGQFLYHGALDAGDSLLIALEVRKVCASARLGMQTRCPVS
jgi:hypothetical protein